MDSWTVTSALLLAGFISSAALNHFDTECYTANGEDYRGLQNQTSLHGGKPCLFWNETFQHPYNTLKYPNGEGGLGSHNYCRNPDGDVQPWCYIADNEDSIYWRYCDIPSCQSKKSQPLLHHSFRLSVSLSLSLRLLCPSMPLGPYHRNTDVIFIAMLECYE
nr:PREDICTED: kremen protein 1-like [Paralichthys olivaceus]